MTREIPPELLLELRRWRRDGTILRLVYGALVLASAICSVFLAAFLGSLDTTVLRITAFVAAACTTIVFSFDLGTKANLMRKGYRLLLAAMVQYQDDTAMTLGDLLAEYQRLGNEIGNVR